MHCGTDQISSFTANTITHLSKSNLSNGSFQPLGSLNSSIPGPRIVFTSLTRCNVPFSQIHSILNLVALTFGSKKCYLRLIGNFLFWQIGYVKTQSLRLQNVTFFPQKIWRMQIFYNLINLCMIFFFHSFD